MDLLGLAAGLVLICANAFFVLTEFSLIRSRSTRLEELAAAGASKAAAAQALIRRLDQYLSACQLGITMSSLGLGWVGEPALARLLEPHLRALSPQLHQRLAYSASFALAFALITVLDIVVGEQTPKFIAIQYPERAAMLAAAPMRLFYGAFYWPLTALNAATRALVRALGFTPPEGAETAHSEEELRLLISSAEEQGKFPLRRLILFENLFDFGRQRVRDVMTPRDAVVSLSLARSWGENLRAIEERKFTRLPLCVDALDSAFGYIHLKDLALRLAREPAAAPDLAGIKRDLPILGEDLLLENALTIFQQKRVPVALAQNAAGRVSGLVTLEDVLEELVGEIRDEFETVIPGSLSESWVPQASILDLAAADRAAAIERLLKGLHQARPEFDLKEAYDVVWKRERGLTSAVGQEIAFPHGRLPGLARPLFAVGRSPSGVPFDAPDKRPVKLIFLILTPLREPTAQLRMLSRIAALVSNRALHRRLLKARTNAELSEIFRVFDQTLPA